MKNLKINIKNNRNSKKPKEGKKMSNIQDSLGLVDSTYKYNKQNSTITMKIFVDNILERKFVMPYEDFLKHITIEATEENVNSCLNMACKAHKRNTIKFFLEKVIYTQRFKGKQLPKLTSKDIKFLIWTINNKNWLSLDVYLEKFDTIEDKLLNIALYPIEVIQHLIEENNIKANSEHFLRRLIHFLQQENTKIQEWYNVFPVHCIYNSGVFMETMSLNCLDEELEYDDGL